MLCPIDGRELQLTHREGIELDYCPECRGIWFDRGELDKIIERSNEQLRSRESSDRGGDRPAARHDGSNAPSKKKKASSFLSDLLEFG
jgi:Zn-finger nucleic acid-binding protein